MKKTIAFAALAAIGLSACGGSSDGGGDDSSPQDEAATMFIDFVNEQSGDSAATASVLDEECVREIFGQMSDDDANALVDAGVDGSPELSAEATELSTRILSECLSLDG